MFHASAGLLGSLLRRRAGPPPLALLCTAAVKITVSPKAAADGAAAERGSVTVELTNECLVQPTL